MRGSLYIAIIYVAVAVYLALAVYVISRQPKRAISWVFGGFCLSVTIYYLTGLFLDPVDIGRPETALLILKIKWAGSTFAPVFFFHLISFYFRGRCQRYTTKALPIVYLSGAGFALTALFSNLLVAGPLYRPSPFIIGPVPGPLMPVLVVFFALLDGGGIICLIRSYHTTPASSVRRQIIGLLTPFGLLIGATAINWIIVLTLNGGTIPHEIGDLLIIGSAFFFANSVLQYGSFVGRPLAWRELLLSTLATIGFLAILYPCLIVDFYLVRSRIVSFPFVTFIVIAVLASAIPTLRRWFVQFMDRLLFPTAQQRGDLTYFFNWHITKQSDPHRLQAELLATLCEVLNARGGCLALPEPDRESDRVTVRFVQGSLKFQPGQTIRLPSVQSSEIQMITSLQSDELEQPCWQEIALFRSIQTTGPTDGLLTIASKKSQESYTPAEVALCEVIAQQIEAAVQLSYLWERRNYYLQQAQREEKVLEQVEEEFYSRTAKILQGKHQPSVPLEIYILGPMQVRVKGQLLPESAWVSERAKAMLAYLLWRGAGGASRDDISMALWPEADEERATNSFHVTTNRLRRILEPDLNRPRDSQYVLQEHGKYRYNFDSNHWLDVAAFEALVKSGNIEDLKKAVDLYRGPYLVDASWALPAEVEVQRRLLEQSYEAALRQLAKLTADGQEVEIYLKKILVISPTDEDALQHLVQYYLQLGRLDLACKQIKNWETILATLGMEASPTLAGLREEIREQDC